MTGRRSGWAGVPGPAAIFLLSPLVYFRQLLPGWAPSGFDTIAFFYPLRHYLATAWQHGRWLPLWTPDVFMGVPFLANIQNAVLYPPSLLFAVVPTEAAIGWSIVLHTGLAGAGLFLYAKRALRLGAAGAAVAAIVYMLGPYMTSHLSHLNQSNTLAWTPWLMLVADRTVRRPTRGLVAIAALLVALVILAGHTQQAYFSLVLAVIAAGGRLWTIRRGLGWRSALLRALPLAGGIALGFGLAAAQLIPTLELVRFSSRGGAGLDLTTAGVFPLPLKAIVGSVLPHYGFELPTEWAGAAIGAAALALASIAVVSRWRRPLVMFWAVVSVLAIVAATGPRGKLYDILFYALPGLRLFRVPARLLLFSTVGGAILAGYGTRTMMQLARVGRRARWRPRAVKILAGAASLGLLPGAAVFLHGLIGRPQVSIFKALPAQFDSRDLALLVVFESLVLLSGAVAVWLARPYVSHALGLTLVAVVLADTWLATAPIYARHPIPDGLFYPMNTSSVLVPASLDQRYLSLLRPGANIPVNPTVTRGMSPYELGQYTGDVILVNSLRPDVEMNDLQLTPDGYDGGLLPLQAYVQFRRPVLGAAANAEADFTIHDLIDRVRSLAWIDEAGVALVLTSGSADPSPPGCRCFTPIASTGDATAWQPIGMQPSRAWLEQGGQRLSAHISADTGERVTIDLPNIGGGRLVLADTYYVGWQAAVDGRPAAIDPVDGTLRGVMVPPGGHQVTFSFEPRTVLLGLGISAGSLALTLLLLLPSLWRRNR